MRNQGFSILEILIALSLLGGISLMGMSIVSNAQKSQTHIQGSVDFDILKSTLNQLISTKNCRASFRGSADSDLKFIVPPAIIEGQNLFPGTSKLEIEQIKQGDTPLVMIDQTIGGKIKITEIAIEDAIYDGDVTIMEKSTTPPTPVTYRVFSSILTLDGARGDKSLGAKKMKTNLSARFLVNKTTDVLTYCGTSSSSSEGSNSLVCRTVRNYSGKEEEVVFCEADETRTGGGCAHSGGAYMYRNFPVVSGGKAGWYCTSGSTGTVAAAYVICCNGKNTASLPNHAAPANYLVFPP